MISIKVSGKSVTIPTSWVEMTAAMWLRIMEMPADSDDFDLVAALSGEEKELFMKSKDTDLDMKFFAHLGWYSKPLDFKNMKVPKTVQIDGKEVVIPKDLGYETLGQKIYLQQIVKKNLDNIELAVPYAFAIYVMPKYTEKDFNADDVDEFIEKFVGKMRITDVFPIGSFFLLKSLDYLKWRVSDYLEGMTQTK